LGKAGKFWQKVSPDQASIEVIAIDLIAIFIGAPVGLVGEAAITRGRRPIFWAFWLGRGSSLLPKLAT
jgi:hypothetical protein